MTNRLENIGSIIRNEHLRKKLTQEGLGEWIGDVLLVSKTEGEKGIAIKTITRMPDILGMSATVVL